MKQDVCTSERVLRNSVYTAAIHKPISIPACFLKLCKTNMYVIVKFRVTFPDAVLSLLIILAITCIEWSVFPDKFT